MLLLRFMVLQAQSDAKKYWNEAKKVNRRARGHPTESERAFWLAQEPILRRIAGELQQRADEWESTVESLAALLGENQRGSV